MSGWICSYRQIWQSDLFKGRGDRVAVWLWMLHTAAWQDTTQDVGGNRVVVKRGQLCVSQRQIEKETGVGRQVIRRLIEDLKATQALTQGATHPSTQSRMLLTICNYDKYQASEKAANPAKNHEPTKEQPIKEQNKQINNIPVGETDVSADISIVKKMAWDAGFRLLSRHGVENPRPVIGKWLKTATHIELIAAIDGAERSASQDPIPYITKILSPASQPSVSEMMSRIDLEGLQ